MRKKILIGNWKMNKTCSETIDFVKELSTKTKGINDVDYGLAIPYISLLSAMKNNHNHHMIISSQNCHAEDSGAFTGEISPPMLKDIGVNWTIIGHSERRMLYGETDNIVNQKLHKLLSTDFHVILCIGETLKQYEAGDTEEVIKYQIRTDLHDIKPSEMKNIVIAYEPIWAIGTGRTASAKQAQASCKFIRGLLENLYGSRISEEVRIQYGGSMNPGNAVELLEQPDIDGGLIGGASLKLDFFIEMIKAGSQCQ